VVSRGNYAVMPTGATDTFNILLVDDNEGVISSITYGLEVDGHKIRGCHRASEALRVAAEPGFRPDVAVVDFVMPEMSGVELCWRLRAIHPGLPFAFITASINGPADHDLSSLQPCLLLRKPFHLAELRDVISLLVDSVR